MGGNDGGPTDVGLPPGVRARVREIPILLWAESVSTEWEWGVEIGVLLLGSDRSFVGVLEVD